MAATVDIEEALYEVFRETDLVSFQSKLAVEKQLTRLDHFQDVTDDELNSYGLSAPAIRRLRNAIERRRKLAKKAKLFGTKKEKFVTISASILNEVHTSGSQASCSTACLIPRDEIKLMENIGEGTFAVVKRAIWKSPASDGSSTRKLDCAVKILHDMSEQVRQDLFSEITNMQRLNHHNLVCLYGVVFGDPTLMVIEFCENGALLDRLRSQTKARLLVTRLLNYAQQIANGMTYLESRGFVHRDLAARNVLLTGDEEIAVCDVRAKKVPFSWCPPESLRFRQFSHKSDVWAFGVTLWEIYTYGEEPYIGCKAVDVLKLTESGERLRMPDYCSKELYDIMNMCWNLSAESRPKFSHLRNLLQDVKFMTAVCREPTPKNSALDEKYSSLALEMDERVILVAERNEKTWFGQSVNSRKFGTFQRSSVTLRSNRTSTGQEQSNGSSNNSKSSSAIQTTGFSSNNFHRREISHPIPGSWIHTGHGDTSEERSWGYVDKIDEIYLRNPVTNNFANNRNPKESMWSDHSMPNSMDQRRRSAQDLKVLPLQTDIACAKPITLPKPARPHAAITAEHFANDHLFEMSSAVDPYQRIGQPPSTSALYDANSGSWQAQSAMPYTFKQDGRAKSETKMMEMRGSVSNGTATNQSSEFAEAFAMGDSLKMVGPPGRHQKSSKYDSTISVPRPQPNRSSPLLKQDIAFFVGAGSMSERVATIPNSTNTCYRAAIPSANIGAPAEAPRQMNDAQQASQFNRAPVVPANTHQPPVFIAEQPKEKDPFLVDEGVKSLANKSRLQDFLPNGGDSTNMEKLSNTIANLKADHASITAPSTSDISLANAQVSATSQPAIASIVLPQPNEISVIQSAQLQPHTSATPSFLPPPSDLLLLGGITGFQSSNSTAAQSSTLIQPFGGHHPASSSHYQPIFDLQQHRTENFVEPTSGNSRIRYGANGIPIMEPTPAPRVLPSSEMSENRNTTKPVMIDLKDLDTDALMARVQNQVDFATLEQCRLSLRKHNFDVENAVRELKIEKLLEIGVAGDRHLAASALDSCKWNVNAAANHLVS
uniref:Non-specific protein-tyrosine kinase n=1 Tax=Ditylenchus dipsaci TaxID=166011 RepID=A0A915D8C8_9BILA